MAPARVMRLAFLPCMVLLACSTGGRAAGTSTAAVSSRPPAPTATDVVGLIPSPVPELAAEPTAPPTSTVPPPVEASALDLVQAFVEAPFRVVAVAPSSLAPYTLIVASERSAPDCGSAQQPQRCTADETCGSIYTARTCYFFLEPAFDAAADPATRYVGRWPETPALAALITGSFRFVDERTVEFRAAGGDGGYSVEEVWWLDLVTGAVALQSRVENSSETP